MIIYSDGSYKKGNGQGRKSPRGKIPLSQQVSAYGAGVIIIDEGNPDRMHTYQTAFSSHVFFDCQTIDHEMIAMCFALDMAAQYHEFINVTTVFTDSTGVLDTLNRIINGRGEHQARAEAFVERHTELLGITTDVVGIIKSHSIQFTHAKANHCVRLSYADHLSKAARVGEEIPTPYDAWLTRHQVYMRDGTPKHLPFINNLSKLSEAL